MKIVMVVRALPIHRLGGLELHTQDLATALAARGHTIVLITSAKPLQVQNDAPRLPENVYVEYLPIGKPGDYSKLFFAGIGAYTNQICKRIGGADVLHTQEFAGLFMKQPDPRTARLFINTVHGTMFTETALDRRYSRLAGWGEWFRSVKRGMGRIALYPQFLASLNRPTRLVTDSEFTRSELLKINKEYQRKISVVPLGINFNRYDIPSEGLPPEASILSTDGGIPPLTVAMIGRVQDLKGIPDALEAVRIVRERGLFIRLRIAGTGEYLQSAQDFVNSHNLSDSVEFLGYLAPGQTSDFLQTSDLLLFPDRTQPAFGLVAVEAMAHGLPVLGTQCGAIPETVEEGENGWLVQPRRPDQIADILSRLASSQAGRSEIRQMAMGAHRKVRRYTAERMAFDMERVYREAEEGHIF